MRRVVVVSLVLLLSLSATAGAGTAAASGTSQAATDSVSVVLDPNTDTYESNTTYQFDVVVTNVSDTVGSYDVTVTSSSKSVLTVQSFTPAESLGPFGYTTISDDNTSVRAVGANASLDSTDGNVTLGTVSVETSQSGSASLSVSVSDLTNTSAVSYTVASTSSVAVVVSGDGDSGIPALPGAAGPPKSTDGDPLLEDVNGDGEANLFDALTYYNYQDSDIIRNNPTQFDFDGDGSSGDLFDALALYNEIS